MLIGGSGLYYTYCFILIKKGIADDHLLIRECLPPLLLDFNNLSLLCIVLQNLFRSLAALWAFGRLQTFRGLAGRWWAFGQLLTFRALAGRGCRRQSLSKRRRPG